MALLNLKIHGVSISTDDDEKKEKSVILTTEETTDTDGNACGVQKMVQFTVKNGEKTEEKKYQLSLMNLQFTKKMYQPTNIIAEIAVFKAVPRSTWVPVPRDQVVSVFQGKKVSIWDRTQLKQDGSAFDQMKVGEDFYVHSVQVKYKVNYMRIYLQICSLDKLMTLEKNCRTFVGKKLKAGILASELSSDAKKSKYVAPYDSKKPLAFDASKMKNLSYDSTEHIFPYLVQYNESFYDMLARTTNRWGEFMFYEDGKLNIGCPNSTAVNLTPTEEEIAAQAKVKDSIKYPDFDTLAYYDVYEHENGDKYDCAASYDDNMLCSPIQKEPNSVSGNIVWPFNVKWDKVVMKKFASFFKNDKNLPTFIGNELFNDLYDIGSQHATVYQKNKKHLDKYFKEDDVNTKKEQYGQYEISKDKKAEGYNPFSEIKTIYDKAKYFNILKHEISVGKNAICISYDTSYPCLKLGQIIKVYDKEYIVTQIDCSTDSPLMLQDDLWVITTDPVKYSFHVYAIPKLEYQTKDKDGKVVESVNQFFPTVIPAGHVRLAEPQMATVTDAGDPNGAGRVRIMFNWQPIKKDSNKKITDDTKKASSPWIQFTANAGGKDGIMGKHYEGDTVFVGFIDGNVERPYVLGALSNGAGADIHCKTPGGHVLKIEDNPGGITSFITGAFTPMFGTLSDFIPALGDFNPFADNKNNLNMAGGFSLTDNYGIYKISGSTDGRNVSIASPWGDVSVNAFTGITISAPNGDISIKGKNVSIEAGNNLSLVSGKNVKYKLWQEKDTRKGSAAQFLLDISAAVTKKLTEKVVNIVDLSIVRSVVEIVLRPVEGKLTVKSNRYLMLEAGKSECKYPQEAYARPEDIQRKLDTKAMDDIMAGAGVGTIRGVGTGMVDLFGSIPGIINHIDETCCDRYKRLPIRKARLKEQLETLNDWKNSIGEDVEIMTGYAKPENFESWFENQIVPKLWGQAEFKEFKEDDLGFTDEVAVEGSANDIVKNKCHIAHYYRKAFTSMHFFGARNARVVDEAIIAKRKELRRACLKTLNKLAKGCWQLEHFYMDKLAIGEYLSAFAFTPVPAEFKEKMTKAFSYEKCKNSRYYNFSTIPKNVKLLKYSSISIDKEYSEYDRTYLKRLVTMNLLEEFGFKDDLRKEIDITVGTGAAAQTVKKKPEKPKTDKLANFNRIPADHILDTDCWKNYVNSLSAIPPLGKADTTIGAAIKNAAGAALDNLMFWKGLGERSTWSAGSNGKIMFAIGKDTYALNKPGAPGGTALVSKENTMSSKITSLSDKDFEFFDAEKQAIQEFVGKIKKELLNY